VTTVLDYGAGNLRSVANALAALEVPHTIAHDAPAIRAAARIILPGVGHFGQMMRALDELQIRQALLDRISAGVPFLGICLGLQALFERSEEAPDVNGLGLFPGEVRRFPGGLRVPHMGWNELVLSNGAAPSRLLNGLGLRPFVYFAHSYYAPAVPAACATCDYGVPFAAALERANVFGVQFHPEKSASVGERVLRNFVEL
jgi:imidazole glycerol phosphate synthase glutamine amidotransferase subunit